MTPFKLMLTLESPAILTHQLTLDALLSAAVYRATGKAEAETIPLIPLEREGDIFRASCLFFPEHYQYRVSPQSMVMGLRGQDDLSAEAFSPNRKNGTYGHVDTQRGPYKSSLGTYTAYESREPWYFYAVGDPEAVTRMVTDFIPGIGRRTAQGFGQVGAVTWDAIHDDFSWVQPSGFPARYLPLSLWQQLGGREDAPCAPFSVKIPYWRTENIVSQTVFPPELCEIF
jgi:CRISPR type IV-associated protein Csf3